MLFIPPAPLDITKPAPLLLTPIIVILEPLLWADPLVALPPLVLAMLLAEPLDAPWLLPLLTPTLLLLNKNAVFVVLLEIVVVDPCPVFEIVSADAMPPAIKHAADTAVTLAILRLIIVFIISSLVDRRHGLKPNVISIALKA